MELDDIEGLNTTFTVASNQPMNSLLVISDGEGKPIVTIGRDGETIVHQEGKVSEAARIFWLEMGRMAPTPSRIEELEAQVASLQGELNAKALATEEVIDERVKEIYDHYRWYEDYEHVGHIRDQRMVKIGHVHSRDDRRELIRKHNAQVRSIVQTVLAGAPPKPFDGVGAWFPIDVLGNPMFSYAEGKWDSYVKRVPFSEIGINPDFWVEQIHTAKHTTDCPAKTTILGNAADHLKRYTDAVRPFVRDDSHDSRPLRSPGE